MNALKRICAECAQREFLRPATQKLYATAAQVLLVLEGHAFIQRHTQPIMNALHSPLSNASPRPGSAASKSSDISIVNLAARQRMLSQRMILQIVLAAQGDSNKLEAAKKTLDLFSKSQLQLLDTPKHLAPQDATKIVDVYHGKLKIGSLINDFIALVHSTLSLIEAEDAKASKHVAQLIGYTDQVLDALNIATTSFDNIQKSSSAAIAKELTGIVGDIQSVAKEAKIVSFNAQVMAARAGVHGREFAVVANVLSGITGEIDQLTRKAAELADTRKLSI